MGKKLSKTINIPQVLMELVVNAFLVAMVGIFPFFYLNNYINITEAKLMFFKANTLIMLLVGLCFYIIGFIQNRKNTNKKRNRTMSVTTALGMVFIVVICISCALSPIGAESFWGEQGRRMGGQVLLLCVMGYFSISCYYQTFQGLIWLFLIANSMEWILIILQFFGIDLLHMYDNLIEHQHSYFMGTMGNVNITAGYTCVALAIIMSLYFLSVTKFSRYCYGGVLMLGFYAAYATQSQSWVLGVGAAAIIILWSGLESGEKLKTVGELWFIFLATSILVKIMVAWSLAFGNPSTAVQYFAKDELFKILLSNELLIAQGILLTLLFFWCHRFQNHKKCVFRRILIIACITVVLAVCFIIFPTDDSFGSNRGYIWRITFEEFRNLPILQKLFGYGPNGFLQFIDRNHAEEMRSLYEQPFIDAHNEAIQFLAVTGIVGMVSYMGMQISMMVRCAKDYSHNPIALVGLTGIAAYLAQGLVNNPQIFITPLLFIFMGIMESKLRRKSN